MVKNQQTQSPSLIIKPIKLNNKMCMANTTGATEWLIIIIIITRHSTAVILD